MQRRLVAALTSRAIRAAARSTTMESARHEHLHAALLEESSKSAAASGRERT